MTRDVLAKSDCDCLLCCPQPATHPKYGYELSKVVVVSFRVGN